MRGRRIRSIPERTTLDVLRERGFSGSPVSIGGLSPRESGQNSLRQGSGGFNVKDHVFQRPTQEKPSRPLVSPEIEGITWQVEIIEDYNNAGDLGLIMRFSGISFASPPVFVESRHDYGPDSRVFYTPVGHKNVQAFLILSTFGDIFESQVVPKIKDVNPFFLEEIRYPPLLTLYDPASMSPFYNNRLVIVSYKPRG